METKLLELYTSWAKFAFGISLNANSLSSDINEAHIMKKKTRKSDTVVNSDQRNKASVHLKVKYLSIGVNTIPDEGPLLETSNLFLSPR